MLTQLTLNSFEIQNPGFPIDIDLSHGTIDDVPAAGRISVRIGNVQPPFPLKSPFTTAPTLVLPLPISISISISFPY